MYTGVSIDIIQTNLNKSLLLILIIFNFVISGLDCVDHELCYPKECNLVVRASYLSYMPLPTSVTSLQTINSKMLATSSPLLCGLYVPKISEIQYEVINIKANSDMRKEFYDIVEKMAESRIFKGFLVFVTDKYFLNTLDEFHIEFLNHFKKM